MTFKERLYVVRNNYLKLDVTKYSIESPLDWSLRKIYRAFSIIITIAIFRPIFYWPVALLMARGLKTRYASEDDKSYYHPNTETIK
jgi:hypothetical protein